MQADTGIIKDIYEVVNSIDPTSVTMTDENGQPTTDRETAKVISFPYFSYGKMSISILNPNNLLVLVTPNMEDNMDDRSRGIYKKFIMRLKRVADMRPDVRFTINRVTGDDFTKAIDDSKQDNLELSKEKELAMNGISEALNPMFGSSRSSYQKLDNIKLIVKHMKPIDENIKGSRTRAIKSIYLENGQGERFRLPVNNLWAGRAMARHMVNSGTMHDVVGQRILEWAGRISKLQKFQRYAKNNGLVNESTATILDVVSKNIIDAKNILQQLSNSKTYGQMSASMQSTPELQLNDDRIQMLKNTFTVKSFDESLSDTLPLIGALLQEKERDQEGGVFGNMVAVMNYLKQVMVSKKLDPKLVVSMSTDIGTPEGASKLARKASDVASEFSGKNEEISNFMSRMSDMLDDHHNRMAFAKEKASPEYKRALALVQAFVNADTLGAFKGDIEENNSPTKYMESFKDWARLITEGVNVSPTSMDQKKKFNELMQTKINLGEDGINAIGSLIGLIEDEKLSFMLSDLAERNAEDDARPVIIEWLKTHNLIRILENTTRKALRKDGIRITEGFTGAALGAVAGGALTKTPAGAMTGAKIGSMAQNELEKIMPGKEQTQEENEDDGQNSKYDRTHGGPFDRGGADAWYGRRENPHKIIDGRRVSLTDKSEIEAYKAGHDETYKLVGHKGDKDYRENKEHVNEARKSAASTKKETEETKRRLSKEKKNDKTGKKIDKRKEKEVQTVDEAIKKNSTKFKGIPRGKEMTAHGRIVNKPSKEKALENTDKKASLERKIKKLESDQGWYGGASGTDMYDRYWKQDLAKLKKELKSLSKVTESKQINEGRPDLTILGEIYNVIREAIPSMPKVASEHMNQAMQAMLQAINVVKASSGPTEKATMSEGMSDSEILNDVYNKIRETIPSLPRHISQYLMKALQEIHKALELAGSTTSNQQIEPNAIHEGMSDSDILTDVYNKIRETIPSLPKNLSIHLTNALKQVQLAMSASSKGMSESRKKQKKNLSEAPVGVGKNLGTWARGKAWNALGPMARGKQAQIAGEKETNQHANKIYVDFMKALGKANIKIDSPEAITALRNWGSRMGYPVDKMTNDFNSALNMMNSMSPGVGDTSMPSQQQASAQPQLAPTMPPQRGQPQPPTATTQQTSNVPRTTGPAIRPMTMNQKPLRPVVRRVAPSAMKEDKKTVNQLIYKMAVLMGRDGYGGNNATGYSSSDSMPSMSSMGTSSMGGPSLSDINNMSLEDLSKVLTNKMDATKNFVDKTRLMAAAKALQTGVKP